MHDGAAFVSFDLQRHFLCYSVGVLKPVFFLIVFLRFYLKMLQTNYFGGFSKLTILILNSIKLDLILLGRVIARLHSLCFKRKIILAVMILPNLESRPRLMMEYAIFSYLHKNCTFFLFDNQIIYKEI